MASSRLEANGMTFRASAIFVSMIGLLVLAFAILLRVEPAIMSDQLLKEFQISPSSLEQLMVKYQLALVITYIFAGYLVDLMGPRTIIVLAGITAITGNILFGAGTTLREFISGRILIGVAHPFIFLGVFALGAQWLPKKYFPLFAAILFTVLLMTPAVITPVVGYYLHHNQFNLTINTINLLGAFLILAMLLTYFIPFSNKVIEPIGHKQIFRILLNPMVISICIVSFLGWTANTFLFNWGAVYLVRGLAFEPNLAISTVAIAFMYFVLGALAMGLLDMLTGKTRVFIIIGYTLAAICFTALIYIHSLSIFAVSNLLFLVGFLTGSATLCYAKAFDYCSPANAGFTFGLVAFVTTSGNTLFALLISLALQHNVKEHKILLSLWQMPLTLIPIALILGAFLATSLRK